MLKIIQIISSIIGMGLALYGLITKDFQYMPVMMLFLGINMLVVGLMDIKKKQKPVSGYMSIAASLIVFIVAFYISIQ